MKRISIILLLLTSALMSFGKEYQKETVRYREDKPACYMDLSYQDRDACAPVIVWFHGGGLTRGKANTPKEFLSADYVVASVEYRFYPEVSVREILDDSALAVSWIVKNIRNYGGDPSLIYLAGHSAGGYIVSMITLDKHYLDKYGVDADTFAACAPFSGQMITHFTERKSRGISKNQPVIDEMAPLYHMRADATPFLIITGDRNLEMIRRYEENAYFYEMMKHIGHKDIVMYELGGFDHSGMAAPGYLLLMNYIKSRNK